LVQTEVKIWVELIAVLSIPLAVGFLILHRIKRKLSTGVRAIQFLAVATLPPTIIVLAFEGILEKSAVGALLGALIGYLFSNIGEYDRSRSRRTRTDDAP